MRLYFDTNVYSFIDAVGERMAVKRFLKSSRHSVRASACNVFEILAISNKEKQRSEFRTLAEVATRFEERPQSWLHAQEVLEEVRRCRPGWLKKGPVQLSKVRQYLREHKKRWKLVTTLNLPTGKEYAPHHRRLESSINRLRQTQKDLRKELLGSDTNSDLDEPWDFSTYLENPKTSWRIDCLCVWREALYVQNPHSRDYCDWLEPYVVHRAFQGRSYVEFWMNDVLEENVRRNRITALVAYYQLHRRITHGNPNDQNHASNLLDVDFFFTCDRAFYQALSDARSHFTSAGVPVLLDRSDDSVVEQMRAFLGAISPKTI